MAQRNVASQGAKSDGSWNRDAKASEDMVRQCKVMVEEELWLGWNQAKEQPRKNQSRDLEEAQTWSDKRRLGGSPRFRQQ